MASLNDEFIKTHKIIALEALRICADIAQEHMGSSSAATGERQRELRDLKIQLTGSIFAGIGFSLMNEIDKVRLSSQTPTTEKGT